MKNAKTILLLVGGLTLSAAFLASGQSLIKTELVKTAGISLPIQMDNCADNNVTTLPPLPAGTPTPQGGGIVVEPSAKVLSKVCTGTDGGTVKFQIDLTVSPDNVDVSLYIKSNPEDKNSGRYYSQVGGKYDFLVNFEELQNNRRVNVYEALTGDLVTKVKGTVEGNTVTFAISTDDLNTDGNIGIVAYAGFRYASQTDRVPNAGDLNLLVVKASVYPGSTRFFSGQNWDMSFYLNKAKGVNLLQVVAYFDDLPFAKFTTGVNDLASYSMQASAFRMIPGEHRFTVAIFSDRGLFVDQSIYTVFSPSASSPIPK